MQCWGLSDPGCVRKQNQDAFQIDRLDRDHLLCVVCDGLGGAKSGNIASSLAIDVFTQEVKRCWSPDLDPAHVAGILRGAAQLANFTVFDQSNQFEEFEGMGTTLVAALLDGETATVLNVGDSRAYGMDRRGITQLTRDHSLVQMMVDRGDLTPELAKTYPGKNFITRAVGTESTVESDIFYWDLNRGSALLLCSDGLSNLLDDQEILFEVVHGVNKRKCCQRLLEIAKSRGAPDNVTSVLVIV